MSSCPKFLRLLAGVNGSAGGGRWWQAQMLEPARIPEPYRALLVHQHDMTSTLTSFHGEQIGLAILDRQLSGGALRRTVVLMGKCSARPLEYGASCIWLDRLAEPVRVRVIEGREPLGGLLNAFGVDYTSCPGGFFCVRPNQEIAQALRLPEGNQPDWLFGRCNCLSDRAGYAIAEVVEILPPSPQRESVGT